MKEHLPAFENSDAFSVSPKEEALRKKREQELQTEQKLQALVAAQIEEEKMRRADKGLKEPTGPLSENGVNEKEPPAVKKKKSGKTTQADRYNKLSNQKKADIEAKKAQSLSNKNDQKQERQAKAKQLKEKHRQRVDQEAQTEYEKKKNIFEAVKKRQKAIMAQILRLDPSDFTDIYGQEVVANDLDLVQEFKERFSSESFYEQFKKEVASAFEFIVFDQIRYNQWLGENVTSLLASDYDDFFNGIDVILDIKEDMASRQLGLAIDVTYGKTTFVKKFSRIKKEIREGKMAQIKYFQNSDGTVKGQLRKLPRVVVSAFKEEVETLLEIWATDPDQLKKHHLQLQILDEMALQLAVFKKYAEKIEKTEVADIYDKALQLIERIKRSSEKQSLYEEKETSLDRRSFTFMWDILNNVFKD